MSTPEAATLVVSPIPGVGDYTTIQGAFDNLPIDGGYILLREGAYDLSVSCTAPDKPILLKGCGQSATRINLGSNPIFAFLLPGPAGYDFVLQDLTIAGDNSTAGQGAVSRSGSGRTKFRNVGIGGLDVALKDTVPATWELEGVNIRANKMLEASGSQNGLVMTDSDIVCSGDAITGFVNSEIEDSVILSNNGSGLIEISFGSIAGSTTSAQVYFDSSSVIGSSGQCRASASYFQNGKLFLVDDGHVVSGCTFNLNAADAAISVTGSECVVDGCRFVGPAGSKFVEESGGADLNVYSANRGFFGSTVIGPDSVVDDPVEQQLVRGFFRKQGLLPTGAIMEELYNFPTPDFSNLNGGTLSSAMSRAKFTPSGNPANFGFDLGALYDKALFIVGLNRPQDFNGGIFVGKTLPATNAPHDAYAHLADISGNQFIAAKFDPTGSASQIGSENSVKALAGAGEPSISLAIYVDGLADRIVGFIRIGSEAWWQLYDITDASVDQFRYAGLFVSPNSAAPVWSGCPVAIYAE